MIIFLIIVLILLSAFLVMIVLLQRGRGGGLAGAFGSGGGSSSAFGTKTGDVFTIVTVAAMIIFMLLSLFVFTKIKWASYPDEAPTHVTDIQKLVQPDTIETTETGHVLRWKDDTSNRLGYRIYRSVDANTFPAKPLAEVGPNQFSYHDTGLTPGTTYYYKVAVWNNGGERLSDVIFSGKTKGIAPPPPPFDPTTLLGTKPALPEAPATTSGPAASAPATPAIGSAPAPVIPAPLTSAPAPTTATKP